MLDLTEKEIVKQYVRRATDENTATHAMARALVAVTDDNCRMETVGDPPGRSMLVAVTDDNCRRETVGDPPGRSMFYKKQWRTVARGLQMSPQVILFVHFL